MQISIGFHIDDDTKVIESFGVEESMGELDLGRVIAGLDWAGAIVREIVNPETGHNMLAERGGHFTVRFRKQPAKREKGGNGGSIEHSFGIRIAEDGFFEPFGHEEINQQLEAGYEIYRIEGGWILGKEIVDEESGEKRQAWNGGIFKAILRR